MGGCGCMCRHIICTCVSVHVYGSILIQVCIHNMCLQEDLLCAFIGVCVCLYFAYIYMCVYVCVCVCV